jgi:hydrogenase-4 component H
VRELVEAVRAAIKGPFTTKFPAQVDSVHPNFRGILKFREEKCIACGACTRVCPARARDIFVDRAKGVMRNVHHAERCIYCGQCVLYCTTREGIYHSQEFDTARTERSADWEYSIEKELAYFEV